MTTRLPLSAAFVAALAILGAASADAAELKLLVSPDLELAVGPLVAAFERETRHTVDVDSGSKARMRSAGDRGGVADVMIARAGQIDQMIKRGNALPEGRRDIGRVGLGVFVREGARVPAINSSEELRKSLLAATGIVYGSSASESGRHIAKLVGSMQLGAEMEAKTTRPARHDEIVDFLLKSRGDDIGIASVTEILAAQRGLKFVGPLPADLQVYTSYAAAVVKGATAPQAAGAFLDHLATPASKARLAAAGFVE